jgi:beta-carotene hydroxylase
MTDSLSPEKNDAIDLDAAERQIAAKYMRMVPWGAVAWAFTNLAVWLSLWPLVLLDIMPLWLGFIIASINVSLSYLPSHEAQHSIIARRGQPLRWLNELVGHLSVIPLVQPYRVLRATHMEHHAHTNNPQLDPDYSVHAPSDFAFLTNSIKRRQPGADADKAYADALQRTNKGHVLIDAVVYNLVYLGFLFAMAWGGYALEAALLWWLPRHIGLTYIQYYLSWAPHHPGNAQGRYRDTRGFKSRLGNLLSLGMQYHIVHHLYPHIPLSKTPAAYRELKPILQQRGCDLGQL